MTLTFAACLFLAVEKKELCIAICRETVKIKMNQQLEEGDPVERTSLVQRKEVY